MDRAIVGLFDNPDSAETAVRALKAAGFVDEEIGIVMRNLSARVGEDGGEQAGSGAGEDAAAGAASGAATGGVVGGLLGLLGSLLLPGVGPIVAGGVLGSALVGAGAGAATGGLLGGLIGMGVPADEAQHFERGVREGRILLTLRAQGERADTARQLMRRHGADLGPSGALAVGQE
jgi:hypothetical protein